MSDGLDDLQRMIDAVRSLADLAEEASPACADAVLDHLRGTVKAGTDSFGKPWPLVRSGDRKGEKALVHAADNMFCAAVGAKIVARITGPDARHHLGQGKGRVKRPILPESSKLPSKMVSAMTAAIAKQFRGQIQGGQ